MFIMKSLQVPYEEGSQLMTEAMEITRAFSDFTGRLSNKIRFCYYVPQELKEIRAEPTERS